MKKIMIAYCRPHGAAAASNTQDVVLCIRPVGAETVLYFLHVTLNSSLAAAPSLCAVLCPPVLNHHISTADSQVERKTTVFTADAQINLSISDLFSFHRFLINFCFF